MQQTYLFYDIETTGLNKCFDQVVQFAAIRTDSELNELERHNILIKLNPDIVPAPDALKTHNIALSTMRHGVGEYEAIQQIHALLNAPGTVSLGYNTLGFDDEFLRFSFYRNLLTPYTHQYANGCSRMDIYPMAAMYYLYKPEALNWPTIEGKPTLKLEHLCAANNLADGAAHDALVDVEATLALAKALYKYPDMWDYLSSYFAKDKELQRLAQYQRAILVDGGFGGANNYQAPVLNLGASKYYKNQSLWLRLDWVDFSQVPAAELIDAVFVVRKKIAETNFLLPFTERFYQKLPPEKLMMADENYQWLQQHPQQLTTITEYQRNFQYSIVPNIDIDAALYQNGFPNSVEQELSRQFQLATPTDKAVMLERMFNVGMRQRAVRILGRHYPEVLPEKYQAEYSEYLQQVFTTAAESQLIDYKNQGRYTVKAALARIDELLVTQLTKTQQQILLELADYLKSRIRDIQS